ncbi:MAG: hypothetical protein HYY06_27965 [Deltaproteobacteria bacterium]|nr:hypothetical protein [Deltaproteobacteria bacterium]
MHRHILFALLSGILVAACDGSFGFSEAGGGGGGGGEGEGEGEGEGGEGEGEAGEGEGEWDPGVDEAVGAGTDSPFDPDAASGLSLDDDGTLSLGGGNVSVENTVIWVANSNQGTVSKLDTRTRVEMGRYWTDSSTGGGNPSRTTVNGHGDVVVSNRNSGVSTKVLASECPDSNGDGSITTSGGGGDVLGWGQDECIAWSSYVGQGARGSAIEERSELDGGFHEYVWIGAYSEGTMYEVDGETGVPTGRSVSGLTPYGAAMGPGGRLWTQAGQALASIDTTTLELHTYPLPGGESWYGLTVDGQGRIWIGGSVARFDPATETWDSPAQDVRGAGIAADGDGNIWTGGGTVFKIDADTLEYETISTGGSEYGWAVDFDGFAWGINIGHNSATVIDPDDNSFVTVSPPFSYPYTYSDMTGFQLRNAVASHGTYTHLATACDGDDVRWRTVAWEADTPAGTQLTVGVRTGAAPESLAPAEAILVATVPDDTSPVDIEGPLAAAGIEPGAYLGVVFTLERLDPDAESPVLRSITVTHECPDRLE